MCFDAANGAAFCIASTAFAVRDGLRTILDHPALASLPSEARGNIELVLAEALNNVVEHAYDSGNGQIDLHLHWYAGRLFCDVFDEGSPMPGNALPTGKAQNIRDDDDLPEGGFGWFLIRSLTTGLTYRRIGARNHLSFQLNIEQ